jgi:hypothetical protein
MIIPCSLPFGTIRKPFQRIRVSFHVIVYNCNHTLILVWVIVHVNGYGFIFTKLGVLPQCLEEHFAIQEQKVVEHAARRVKAVVPGMRREEELFIEHRLVPRLFSRKFGRHTIEQLDGGNRRPNVKKPRIEHPYAHCVCVPRPSHGRVVHNVIISIGRLIIKSVRHTFNVTVAVKVQEWVLQVDNVDVREEDAVAKHQKFP